MNPRRQAMEKVLAADDLANRFATNIKDAQNPTDDYVAKNLRGYVLAKLRLHSDETNADNLNTLMEASLAKTLKVAPEEAIALDTSLTCESATSVSMKKNLLLMAIERDFCIELNASKTAQAQTIGDLACIMRASLPSSPDFPAPGSISTANVHSRD